VKERRREKRNRYEERMRYGGKKIMDEDWIQKI